MLIGGIWILKVKLERPLHFAMVLIALSAIWDYTLAFDLAMPWTVLAAIFSGISLRGLYGHLEYFLAEPCPRRVLFASELL
jgi:hypothetical protein